jgi:hypothetical protein
VRTPAEATAFARLEAAGLPTTPETVRGFAALVEGSPVGRALASLLGEAGAAAQAPAAERPPTGPATPGSPAPAQAPPADAAPPAPGSAATRPASLPQTYAPAPGAPPPGAAPPGTEPAPAAGQPAPAAPAVPAPPPAGTPAAAGEPALQGAPRPPAAARGDTAPPVPGAATPAAARVSVSPLAETVAQLSRLADALAEGAASGDPVSVRAAVAGLGHGIEAGLAHGRGVDDETLRGHLQRLATQAGPETTVARAADRLAEAVVAQALVGPTLPGSDPAATGSPSQGAYLQLPLPGGQSAEVRVNPDAGGQGRDGEKRGRRIAFLLHLSALGPVLIEANHGPTGTEAIVRVSSAPARAYLAGRTQELADALRRSSDTQGVRVAVERFQGPPPERLVPPPPASGLELRA